MNVRQRTALLVNCCLALCFGLPSAAQAFKVYIATDMEGCSGVASSEQIAADVGKELMAGDMNACIAGCFAAGATEVVVRDIHGGGRNVEPQVIDRRAKLIQGSTPEKRFKDVEGSAAIILLGYHARGADAGRHPCPFVFFGINPRDVAQWPGSGGDWHRCGDCSRIPSSCGYGFWGRQDVCGGSVLDPRRGCLPNQERDGTAKC